MNKKILKFYKNKYSNSYDSFFKISNNSKYYCIHKLEYDYIDINIEKSMMVIYCNKCYKTFKNNKIYKCYNDNIINI